MCENNNSGSILLPHCLAVVPLYCTITHTTTHLLTASFCSLAVFHHCHKHSTASIDRSINQSVISDQAIIN